MTRICIFGAGAIGGYVGAALHEAGAEVSLVARGQHLEAIRADGLGLEKNGKVTRYSLPASNRPADLGPQDYVILAIKAHTIPMILDDLMPLLGPRHSCRARRQRPALVVFPQGADGNSTCLLYTSPSPRDLSTSRMPSSA